MKEPEGDLPDARVSELLLLADEPPPRTLRPAAVRRKVTLRRLRRSGGIAAAMLVVLTAAALALPGSPVRRWMEGRPLPPDAAPAPAPDAARASVRHLSVLPPPSVEMIVSRPDTELEIQARISDDPWLEVWTAAGERLESLELADGRLTVRPGPVGMLRVTIPEDIRMRIVVDGELLIARDGRAGPPGAVWRDSTVRVTPAGRPPDPGGP